jgi:hypothetical protein
VRRLLLLRLLPLLPLCAVAASASDGYRLYEATAASVNREVLFLTDVIREQCMRRCVAIPGSPRADLTFEQARAELISDTLAIQEQRKLELGQVDNAALAVELEGVRAMLAKCASPCRATIAPEQVSEWVERKLLIRDFLRRRVAVFVKVNEEDVRRAYRRRAAQAGGTRGLTEEQVKEDLLKERVAEEVRNWYERAASKSRIILSPMEEEWKERTP